MLQFTNLSKCHKHPPVSGEIVFSKRPFIPVTLLTALVHTPARSVPQTGLCASLTTHWKAGRFPHREQGIKREVTTAGTKDRDSEHKQSYNEERKNKSLSWGWYFTHQGLKKGTVTKAVAEKRQNHTLWDFLKSKDLDAQKSHLETEQFHKQKQSTSMWKGRERLLQRSGP